MKKVLVIDWPDRSLPESLARDGWGVIVRGGPGPTDFSIWEFRDGTVSVRPLGAAPDRADLVYMYRPFSELPSILSLARELGAGKIWAQYPPDRPPADSEIAAARALVESSGLEFTCNPAGQAGVR